MKTWQINILKILSIIPLGCCRLIGKLTIRNRNKIVFGAWFGNKYDDNPKALYEYVVNNRKDIDACWITRSKEVLSELKTNKYPVCKISSWRSLYYHLTAKYVVYCVTPQDLSNAILLPLLSGATFINLWHGIPLKKIGKDNQYDVNSFANEINKNNRLIKNLLHTYLVVRTKINKGYIVSSSDAISKIYQGAFGLYNDHILCLGQARNDYFYNNHINVFRERFKGKKIIVYMPTHRNEGNSKMDFHDLLDLVKLNELCSDNNVVLLLKKHFYHNTDPVVSDGEYSNIIELTHENVKTQELLDASDILITDYSSTYIDYLLLNRPIIFFAYDLEHYLSNDREMYLTFSQENIPGRICINHQELEDEIRSLLQLKDSFEEQRNRIKDFYYNKDNQHPVSQKQIETIISLN